MRIVFTSEGESFDAALDMKFGRAGGFLVFDEESGKSGWIPNDDNMQAPHGAGTQSAQLVIREKPDAIITGNIGPKASEMIRQAGIPVYLAGSGTVREAYEEFKDGKLEKSW